MSILPYSKIIFHAAKCISRGNTSMKGSSRNLMSKQLVYSEFGDPLHVVKFRECEIPPLDSQEVLVRMLAAPVNPADINTIQGKYPVKICLPMVPGNEGVGIIEGTGLNVKAVCRGNKVVITKPALGTWATYGVFHQSVIKVVPKDLGLAEAAMIMVNPCTAYRMLTDFKPVREQGLVVIQNGANSACGQNVIQLCRAWGIGNIGIIRDRPDVDKVKNYLLGIGASYVLTEEELRTTNIFKDGLIDKPSLALNCVGGKSALEMVRHLQHSGCMVTYGGMSRQPVSIPTAAFIFKNISFCGFWMTAWNEVADYSERDSMLNEIICLMCEGRLKAPLHRMIKFDQYKEALENTLKPTGYSGMKYILDFNVAI